VKTSFKKLKS